MERGVVLPQTSNYLLSSNLFGKNFGFAFRAQPYCFGLAFALYALKNIICKCYTFSIEDACCVIKRPPSPPQYRSVIPCTNIERDISLVKTYYHDHYCHADLELAL